MAERRMQTPGTWERGLRVIEASVNRELTEKPFLQGTDYACYIFTPRY